MLLEIFCSGGSKLIFALLTEVIAGHVVITPINIKKPCFEKTFIRVFRSRRLSFYYCLNDILYIYIWVNFWQGFGAYKSGCRYIERPWECY